jgi:hypothetical protein
MIFNNIYPIFSIIENLLVACVYHRAPQMECIVIAFPKDATGAYVTRGVHLEHY